MSDSIDSDIQAIVDDAQDNFDLGARLRGTSVRTKEVRVYTDEVTGEKLGGAEIVEEFNADGIRMRKPRSWGLTAELIALKAVKEPSKEELERIETLKLEIKGLAEKLEASSIDFKLRAIPKVIKKDAKRAAREHLGIKGKLSVEDPRFEDFLDEEDAQLFHRTVVSFHDHQDGRTRRGITVENARALKAYLPDSEYSRLAGGLRELLYQNAIADKVTEDADF
jgi:hypothetical protein